MASMKKKPTVKDVAALAKVSTASVSRYLNNVKGHLSEENQLKIANAIQMLNYTPNLTARQMVKRKSYQIALLVANADDRFSTQIFKGASKFLGNHGYQLVLLDSDGSLEKEKQSLRTINRGTFDGILYQPLNSDLSSFKELIAFDKPAVVLDRQVQDKYYVQVISKNYEAAKKLTTYYLSKGISNIIVISSPVYSVSTRIQRLHGIKSEASPNAIQLLEINDSNNLLNSNSSRTILFKKIEKLIDPYKKNLLFFLEERFLLGVIPMLLEEQEKLNNKLEITGFVDSPIVSWIFPKERFIHQQPFKMGLKASEILLQLINKSPVKDHLITIDNKINI